jgi:hypothetical protein
MDMIDDAATRPPSVILIDGREYALYQGFRERTKLVDVKWLWLDAAKNFAILLSSVLLAVSLTHPDSSLWLLIGYLAAVFAFVAVSFFMESRSVAVVPVSVVEKDRQAPSATLYIFLRSVGGFSTRRDGRYTATVHIDMADFLLGAVDRGRARRFSSRPRIPAELRNPTVWRFVWGSYANSIAALAVLVVAFVILVTRHFSAV